MVDQGFFNVYLIQEKYFIDMFDLKRCITLEQKLSKYLICRKERWDLTINRIRICNWNLNNNLICICKLVGLNILIVWINYMTTNVNNLMISLRFKRGVEQGFLNVFLHCEKYLIDKFDQERYLTITLILNLIFG